MKLPWRTLRGRLALASLVGLLASAVAFAALGIQLVRSQTVAREVADLSAKAKGIGALVSQDLEEVLPSEGKYDPGPERIATLEAIAGAGTTLVYVGPNLAPGAQTPALERAAIAQVDEAVLQRDGVQEFEYDPPGGARRIAAAAPIVFSGEVIGAWVLTREKSEIVNVWQRVATRVLIAALIGLLFALIVTTFLTTRALRPLRRFQTAAIAVGQGNLETRVEAGGTEEVDALASAFNTMVRELRYRDQVGREFLMRVTHDLRTPLTAIRGHTQALADGVVPAEAIPRSLNAIDDESERLDALVTDLLDLAKLEARRFRLDLETVDGTDLVDRAFHAYTGEATRRGLVYERDIDTLPEIHTDAARVRQIIGNLIDNAFNWTSEGGTVTVTGRIRREGGIVVAVTDSGPGIPDDKQEEIFQPFRSEDSPDGRSGSGLGLAISRQLSRALGGDLYVDGTYRHGSRFMLELPSEAHQADLTR